MSETKPKEKSKDDLTRIENLSEFLHQENEETNSQLETFDKSKTHSAQTQTALPDLPTEASEEAAPAKEELTATSTPPDLPTPTETSVSPADFASEEAPPDFDPDAKTDPNLDISQVQQSSDENPPAQEEISLSQMETGDLGVDAPATEAVASDNAVDFSDISPTAEDTSSQVAGDPEAVHQVEELGGLSDDNLQASADSQTASDLETSQDTGTENSEQNTTSTQISENTSKTEMKKPEGDLSDLINFSEAMSYGAIGEAQGPNYSIVVTNINYIEDTEDILIILKEHGIVTEKNEAQYKKSLQLGKILIPQISEYSAVYLAHKLRRFSGDVSMGLSDEIRPPKSYQDKSRGPVSKRHLLQNQFTQKILSQDILPQEVLLSTAASIQGQDIAHYLGIVSEHTVLSETLLSHYELQELVKPLPADGEQPSPVLAALTELKAQWFENSLPKENSDPAQKSFQGPGLNDIYFDLAQKLKPKAAQMKGNAVIGISFQITPLTHSHFEKEAKYKLTCSGSVVLAKPQKLQN